MSLLSVQGLETTYPPVTRSELEESEVSGFDLWQAVMDVFAYVGEHALGAALVGAFQVKLHLFSTYSLF